MMRISILLVLSLVFLSIGSNAQTTEFTFQGSLKDNAAAANGNYDFEFAVFDAVSGGSQIGATIPQNGVPVANGIFAVKLDFGLVFPGTSRYLEIRTRMTGQPGFTTLVPRQLVNSAPYSVKSLNTDSAATATNALQLGGVAANQYVVTTDPRMTDARPPTAGSANYVQNTTSPQASSNFNISGTGTANILNAATQFNIAGGRVFSIPGSQNVFAGFSAGTSNTTGFGNTFVGNFAGSAVTTPQNNSFFGADAGRNLNGGNGGNSFFGRSSGFDTTEGFDNAFFGLDSGRFNTTGISNAYFGMESGFSGTIGSNNSFFGQRSGRANVADGNSFFGFQSGVNNITGTGNSFFGNTTGRMNVTGSFNSFFGDSAGNVSTGTSNSFFGTGAGASTGSGGNNAFFGTIAGQSNSTGGNNTFFGAAAGTSNTTGTSNSALGFSANVGSGNLTHATAIGADSTVSLSNTISLGRSNGSDAVAVPGALTVTGALTANLPAGDPDYVQNRTTQQASTNFNISNTGTANIFNAGTQFNISSSRVLGVAGTANLFVGISTGPSNSGSGNTFIGSAAGISNSTGMNNTYIGSGAGANVTTGSNNVVIGANSDLSSTGISNSIVIGSGQTVSTSNTLAISASTGNINVTSLHLNGNVDVTTFKVNSLGASGSNAICTNGSGFFSNCSSSLRYKSNVLPFHAGLDLVKRLRPISFNWKDGGMKDVGFGAEDVAKIDRRFITYNDKGEIEGVKYAQMTTVLVNAVNEQQAQIEAQQKQIAGQRKQIESLVKLVCATNPKADFCQQ